VSHTRGLGEIGVSADVIPTLAGNALEDACLTTNPRETSAEDIAALFRAAM
jgi:1,3-propanediol dehydrogenase